MPAFAKAAAGLAVSSMLSSYDGLNTTSYSHVWPGINNTLAHMGVSHLGTALQPHLPSFMTNNPLPQGFPWGPKTAKNTNYYYDPANTGVTRYYDWTVSRTTCAPDGVELDNACLLVNNQFPGPLIEANWGDWIEVKVTNDIPDEGTSIHWHGFLQKQTPWFDGAPGVEQCPIAPGSTFTYRFKADLYGTTWWHSHYSSQYGSGLWGPIVVYGPKNMDYDVDVGPVMLSDLYHEYYETAVEGILRPITEPPVIPLTNNNLINGKNSFDCSKTDLPCTPDAPLASFNFTSGKTHRLRLINPSSASTQKFTIDGHTMTVIANDFVEVEPYETDQITLAVGQRSDVLVKAIGKPTDAVYMRAVKLCAPSAGSDEAKAAIYYENADRNLAPTSSPGPNTYNEYCGNDPLEQTVPYYPIAAGEPAVTEVLPIEFRSNGTHLIWFMANRTFRVNYNDPQLLEAKLGSLNFPFIENVHNYGSNSSVRFIFENTGNQPHPMHLHGHNIFILAEGSCTNNGTVFEGKGTSSGNSTAEKRGMEGATMSEYGNCWDGHITNPDNPQRRDVQQLLPGQYIVVQWNQDNPGVWPFHCHIAWHLSAGFVWMVLERPEDIMKDMQIPSIVAQTCRDWSAYTGDHVVPQIDDGL